MTTTAQSAISTVRTTPSRLNRRGLFFPGMGLLAVLIVLLAFVPEYAGRQHMKPPTSWPVSIHAAIMVAWIALFFVQAYLGATGRIAQHRRIGNFGFALGWLALLSMMFVHFRALAMHPLPEDRRIYDWLLPFLYVYFSFSVFFVWAYRKRVQPAWHKRLITFALFISLEAAVQRLQWLPSGFGYWPFAAFLDFCLLAPLITFDAVTLKWKLHPATARGGTRHTRRSSDPLFVVGNKCVKEFRILSRSHFHRTIRSIQGMKRGILSESSANRKL